MLATDADTPVVAETTVGAAKANKANARQQVQYKEDVHHKGKQTQTTHQSTQAMDVPDLLQALEVITQADGDLGTVVLEILASDPVLLSVKEPQRDVECLGVLQDAHDLLHLLGRETTSAKRENQPSNQAA